jgi:hypothetical protein
MRFPGYFVVRSGWLALGLVVAGGMSSWCWGQTVTLVPSADTTLMELSPFNNMGAVESMAVGVTGNGTFARALLRFDLSSIPANATITSARLTSPVVKTPGLGEESTFVLHRVKRGWGEGNKGSGVTGTGAAASEGEATWAARQHPLTLWGSGGGASGTDYEAAPSASADMAQTLQFETSPLLVADVQTWVSTPSLNFGWLIKDVFESETSQTAVRLASRESLTARTELTVSYTAGNPTLRITEVGLEGGQLCLKFTGSAGKSYVVERRSGVDTGAWMVIQTIPSLNMEGIVTACDPLGTGPAFYRVAEQ